MPIPHRHRVVLSAALLALLLTLAAAQTEQGDPGLERVLVDLGLQQHAATLAAHRFSLGTLREGVAMLPSTTVDGLVAVGLARGEALALAARLAADESDTRSKRHSKAPGSLALPRPFGTVICNGSEVMPPGTEVTVFEHRTSAAGAGGPAALTHWQFTANGTFSPWTLRFYIDGESTASLVFSSWMGGGCTSCAWGLLLDPARPWGIERLGKGAAWPGAYNNFQVPFNSSLRLTVEADAPCVFFSILRGAEGVVARAGGMDLPPSARLRVQALEDKRLQPLERVTLLQTAPGRSGVLLFQSLVVKSANANFLEACTRLHTADGMMYIGDGEDYFDSAWYFNGGTYTFPQAGLTFACGPGGPPGVHPCSASDPGGQDGGNVVSAYRLFDWDPIAWTDAVRIEWRNGETAPAPGIKCAPGDPPGGVPIGSPQNSTIFSYVWYYEF